MNTLVMVALGGAIGSVLRYGVGALVAFPFGTLAVNVAGSLLIGAGWAWLAVRAPAAVPFLMVGILGGFTTFSTFSLDTLRLLGEGRIGLALAYVLASVLLSLAACGLGIAAFRGAA